MNRVALSRRDHAAAARSAGPEEETMTTEATDWTTAAPGVGGYADVNGIRLYYEVHGTGRPLVLLHGGLGAIEMFGPNLESLAAGRQVIGVDLQGHGRTADVDRPINIGTMGDDIAALAGHLGLDQVDVMGYSLGGGVALQVVLRHPALVRRLVMVSTNIRRDAFYPDILAQQGQVNAAAAEFMKQTPMYELYASIAPRPEDFPRLLQKMGEAMSESFDFSRGGRGDRDTDARRRRRRRHLPGATCRRGLRAARRRSARRRVGRLGAAEVAARHPPGGHPLHDLREPSARHGGDRVPRRGDLAAWPPGRLDRSGPALARDLEEPGTEDRDEADHDELDAPGREEAEHDDEDSEDAKGADREAGDHVKLHRGFAGRSVPHVRRCAHRRPSATRCDECPANDAGRRWPRGPQPQASEPGQAPAE